MDASTGWNAGIFAQFKLLGLALQPELLYAERGTDNTSMKYIDLPVNLRINLFSIPKTLTPFIIGGPYFSYALDGEVKMTEIVQDFDYKKFDYGLGLGVGCDLLNRFQLTGRYDWGFEKTGNVEKTCSEGKLRFSIKTRIGLRTAENAAELLKIYNRYPLCELIVHPRTQTDLYKGTPDLETFEMILEDSAHPVVYNGDIFTIEDYTELITRFPECPAVMIGRGLIANPALAREIRGGAPLEKEELRRYHDSLYTALRQTLPGAAPLIGKMKELWFYMGRNFADSDRFLKEIRKARDLVRYEAAVRTLFAQGKFLPGKKITF